MLYVMIGIIVLIVIYTFVTYNSLQTKKNRVDEAFSTMDVYLKKRWDLIPNLVETVKGYAKHEKDTLEEVIALRNNIYDNLSYNDKVNVNSKLTNDISKLMALSEAYPDLKADKHFQNLSIELSKVEDEIANARKYYNGTIRLLNNKVDMFPSNVVAKLFGFKSLKMFEVNASERANVSVEL